MNADPKSFAAFTYRLVSHYTAHPEQISVEANAVPNGMSVRLPGTFHKSDYARLVGKKAGNYFALQQLLNAFGYRRDVRRTDLTIMEPPGPRPDPQNQVSTDLNWNRDREMADLLAEVCTDLFDHPVQVSHQNGGEQTLLLVHHELSEVEFNALKILFKAIGRTQGHRLEVTQAPGGGIL